MYKLKLFVSSLPCRFESCCFRIQTQVLEERSQRHSWTAAPQKSRQFTSNPKLLQPVSGNNILGAIADMEESSSNVEGQKSWSQKKSRKSFLFVLVQLRAAKGREVFDEIAVSPFRLFQTARPLAQVEGVKKEQDSNDGCDTPNLATKRCCAYFNDFKWIFIYIYMCIW